MFVAAEFALVRARRARLEALAPREARAAPTTCSSSSTSIDRYLAACQIGITMASIGIGFLGEPAIATLIEPALGPLSHGVSAAIAFAIAFVLVTSLHITVGEQVPKMVAINRAESVARGVARPLRLCSAAIAPRSPALLNRASNAIVAAVRRRPGAASRSTTTPTT